eukprot:GHVN01070328.1.p1 GENE.GHVN01070328.1~~GHVN01070328.1.p1  ORF type:complete len:201 (-),score=17.17 GHVN01070328.1:141-743(-)
MVSINAEESSSMQIGSPPIAHYCIDGVQLRYVHKVRDLGVYYDRIMKFNSHVDQLVAKASLRIIQFKQCFKSRHMDVVLRYHLLFIRPMLEYCVCVWWGVSDLQRARVEAIQRKMLRLVRGFHVLSYEERLSKTGLSSIADRAVQYDMVQAYKIMNMDGYPIERWEGAAGRYGYSLRSGSRDALTVPFARLQDRRRAANV